MPGSEGKTVLLAIRHPVGGIRTYIQYIFGQPWFDEYQYVVLSPDENLKAFYEQVFAGRGFEFVSCEENNRDMLGVLWKYARKHRVDLIHSHGFTAGSLSVPVSKLLRVPHIMTAHDVFQDKQFHGIRGAVKKRILSMLFRRIDVIHTVSNDATENLLSFLPGVRREQIWCIPHGIDAESFYRAEPAKLGLDGEAGNRCLIGFFGRFMAQKGFRYLIDAIEIMVRDELTDIRPLVLTFDWGGFVREEYEVIERKGLQDYFRMMQFATDMPAMIKAMDIVAMPSLWESSGLLGMESLVAGTPIVGAGCIGLREVLDGSPAIMVPPADAAALATALAGEINHPRRSEFERYAEKARHRFSIERPSSELHSLYKKVLC